MNQSERLYLTKGEIVYTTSPTCISIYNGPDQNLAMNVKKALESTLDDKHPPLKSVTEYDYFWLEVWESGKCVQQYTQSNKLEGWVELYRSSEASGESELIPDNLADSMMSQIHIEINKIYDNYLATEIPELDGKIFSSGYYGLDQDMLYLSPEKATRVREKLEREHQQSVVKPRIYYTAEEAQQRVKEIATELVELHKEGHEKFNKWIDEEFSKLFKKED